MTPLARLGRYSYWIIGISLTAATMTLLTQQASSEEQQPPTEAAQEAHLVEQRQRGQIEGVYLFHPSLDASTIQVEVRENRATLVGEVESHVQRDLAQELAMSIDGIDTVSNQLQVNPRLTEDHHSSPAWGEQPSDSALLAKVKTRLLANINLPGTRIEVDTQQGHVTLSGEVDHRDQQELAYYTTLNTQGVRSVESTLNVTPKEE
mgnify:CR=1 FL=1